MHIAKASDASAVCASCFSDPADHRNKLCEPGGGGAKATAKWKDDGTSKH
jgi:hypothetical protein